MRPFYGCPTFFRHDSESRLKNLYLRSRTGIIGRDRLAEGFFGLWVAFDVHYLYTDSFVMPDLSAMWRT